ncbi:MAG TPA: hypothetical protein VME46_08750, partial [Acidimicrobiales bacterium]|nr:hypothetical protein [Acidimicrobiales bacterium]
ERIGHWLLLRGGCGDARTLVLGRRRVVLRDFVCPGHEATPASSRPLPSAGAPGSRKEAIVNGKPGRGTDVPYQVHVGGHRW